MDMLLLLMTINKEECQTVNTQKDDNYHKISHTPHIPASSAPVERVFSNRRLIVRPHRAKISDQLLESLVFAKCSIFS